MEEPGGNNLECVFFIGDHEHKAVLALYRTQRERDQWRHDY